jgi:hypothetical protein
VAFGHPRSYETRLAVTVQEVIHTNLLPVLGTPNGRSCTWPLRVNTSDSPVDRYRDKKAWTRGLSWHPSGPRPPGADLDAGRADTRRPLSSPPLTASPPSQCAHTPAGWGHGGTRKSSTSRSVQTWSVRPAAIAGVQGRPCWAEPTPLVSSGCGKPQPSNYPYRSQIFSRPNHYRPRSSSPDV